MNTEQKEEQKANDKKNSEMFDDLYARMEERLKELTEKMKNKVLPHTEESLRKNVFKTVSLSFLAGSIVGILLMALGSRRGPKN
jgi:ElaB/YqjD/DUF883 family membrane-anchored ribosome-binding protein